MKVVVVIPARSGSKRVPGKNIRELNGVPLVKRSIKHASDSLYVHDIVLTTDDVKAAEIGHSLGIKVIDRPLHLAGDDASTVDTVLHVIKTLDSTYDVIVLLQPTVPFREPGLIDTAIEMFRDYSCDAVISHIPVDYFHPNRMKKIVNGFIEPYSEKEIPNIARSQLNSAFYRDGSIYAIRVKNLIESESFIGHRTKPIITDPNKFVNIDSERDWLFAELLAAELEGTFNHHSADAR